GPSLMLSVAAVVFLAASEVLGLYGEGLDIAITVAFGILFIGTGILALWTGVWVLRQKNRSTWWMLFPIWVPFGFVVLIALENHSNRMTGVI
ncbi:MAG: hypothetical protein JXA57_05130, partial [Armatimonadetes bacterium]|nr:hypothetical protein [Armatimonadota bacterium]